MHNLWTQPHLNHLHLCLRCILSLLSLFLYVSYLCLFSPTLLLHGVMVLHVRTVCFICI